MPNKSSYADFMTDWERLLQAVNNNGNTLPNMVDPVTALTNVLTEIRSITARQDYHRAGLRGETRRLRELLTEGRDNALRIRSAIRSHLGPRQEKLAEFRIPVLGRNRPVSTQPVPPVPPPEPTE
ncbi:MAG TPA: hypothetical protein VH394_07310 [Thermoanaerobaculia bacterium]|jgi:hypothetical protein|nr:hypothetical protein [Thermoanaerobaculia bacterium]